MTESTTPDRIIQEISVSAPADKVFRALTEAAELGKWIAMSAESDPRTGGSFRYNWTSMGVNGVYGAVEPNRLVETHWDGWEPGDSNPVIWELSESNGATRVLMTNIGGDGPAWVENYDGLVDGWTKALRDLKDWVETGAVRPDGFRTE